MRRAVLVLMLMLATTACSYLGREPEPYRPADTDAAVGPDRGRDLYLKDCAWCHGNDGSGTERGSDLRAGTNGAAATDFMLSTGRMPLASPDQPSVRRPPAYSSGDMAAITDYVAELGGRGPDIPETDIADADLVEGAALYQENCAACHSTSGIGGALTVGSAPRADVFAPDLRASSPVQVAEAIRVGPGTMPVFSEAAFSDEQVNALAAYVDFLQQVGDPGGWGLGRVGPVPEGAVAWIVGLGAMVLFVRWIGESSRD